MRLLIVEDDVMLGATMSGALKQAGYAVEHVTSAEDGDALLSTDAFDAVVLDLALPGMGGLDLVRRLRQRHDATPILIVTAQDRLERKIEGLDVGADDYLVKPFDLDELLARIRVQVRRKDGRNNNVVEVGEVSIDLAARQVTRGGALVALTAKEFRVLAELARRGRRFVTKDELEAELYDDASQVESNTVEVAIYGLRRKLGSDFILTARGLGYMIRPDR